VSELQHRFVRGMRSRTTAEYLPSASKKWESLHVAQGQLDSLCGICSLGMAAMLLLRVPRSQVLRLSEARRGPFAAMWELASEVAFTGAGPADLLQMATMLDPTLTCRVLRHTRPERIASEVTQAIEAGAVPLLEFESRTWAHWTLLVGYEQDRELPRALLALDPDHRAPDLACFNARIELDAEARSAGYPLVYRAIGRPAVHVRARSLLVIARAPPR
jgi:hypothetical protein